MATGRRTLNINTKVIVLETVNKPRNRKIGFEEKVLFSLDFNPKRINLSCDETYYSVHSVVYKTLQGGGNNYSIHRFRFSRFFTREIKQVEIEAKDGEVKVLGYYTLPIE
ncbi:hypothetical protein NGRA_0961 [Nosema granulosis]|uniref:Uncharacterized protein n=1 Tax=Nosema granulosis TaxID=83296 RepID=A0A9P6KZU3_9MICR|nr:hypothetical protein NGRA_0961 [Nosema granulosis]